MPTKRFNPVDECMQFTTNLDGFINESGWPPRATRTKIKQHRNQAARKFVVTFKMLAEPTYLEVCASEMFFFRSEAQGWAHRGVEKK